jgi:G:T-mismatch repair DNA endonuclease (very short patch repair protein)
VWVLEVYGLKFEIRDYEYRLKDRVVLRSLQVVFFVKI